MGAVARELHETAQAVTNTFTSHRHFSIIVSQFDWFWKRIKAVRRVISDLSGQIDQRAQYVEMVVLMCALNPPQFDASWKRVETCLRMIFDLRNQFDYGAQGIKIFLVRWWDYCMRPYRWMPRMSLVAKVGMREIAPISNMAQNELCSSFGR